MPIDAGHMTQPYIMCNIDEIHQSEPMDVVMGCDRVYGVERVHAGARVA